MKNCLLSLIILLTLLSCENKPTQKELKILFDKAKYDESVMQNLSLYDTLKDVILSNVDTIFKFRNSRNYIFHGGKDSATIREDSDEYPFFFVFDKRIDETSTNEEKLIDIGGRNYENMPAFLYPTVERLFKEIGKDKISGFYLKSNGTMTIPIKEKYHEEINADVYHTLYWNSMFEKNIDPNDLMKDTLIGSKWTYLLGVMEHQ